MMIKKLFKNRWRKKFPPDVIEQIPLDANNVVVREDNKSIIYEVDEKVYEFCLNHGPSSFPCMGCVIDMLNELKMGVVDECEIN